MDWKVQRQIVPHHLINNALRLLHIDVLGRGLDLDTITSWLWSLHWFPHLKWHSDIVAVARALPEDWQLGKLCDPQILLQFPQAGPAPDMSFHTDVEPDWADDRRYTRIVAVPLTQWNEGNGGVTLLPSTGLKYTPDLHPGDALLMDPSLLHSGGINKTGAIRYGIYFRWLG